MNKKFKEVIVVEGKSDTTHLNSFFGDIDTIETKGSAIDKKIIEKIKLAHKTRGAIVLTDPDFNGNKIRQKIVDEIPDIKQAFLPRKQAAPQKSGNSLGIEHANKEDILQALKNVVTYSKIDTQQVTQEQLIELRLMGHSSAKRNRELVGDDLHIGYGNAKQFLKKINQFNISFEQLKDSLQKIQEK